MVWRGSDTKVLVTAGLLTGLVATGAFGFLSMAVAVAVATVTVVCAVTIVVRVALREVLNAEQHSRVQQQAAAGLYAVLTPRLPLPLMLGWSATPELSLQITSLILGRNVQHVFEAGSGVSTLIAGYALAKASREQARVTSLDHDAGYAEITRAQLAEHGFREGLRVLHAPLVEHQIRGGSWQWYDLSKLPDGPPIDLLVVDGPAVKTQPMARYPALPLLFSRLSPDAVVVLDDAARDSERAVVARWLAEYPGQFEHHYLETAKGVSILKRIG